MRSTTAVLVAVSLFGLACSRSEKAPITELVVAYPPSPPGTNTAELMDETPGCVGTCPRTPDIEKLGHLCTLDRGTCTNGILTCYYNCVPVEEPEAKAP